MPRLTSTQFRCLALLSALPEQAMSTKAVGLLLCGPDADAAFALLPLLRHGLADRARMRDQNGAPFRYWRTAAGQALLDAEPFPVATDRDEDDELLRPGNHARGAVAFREAMETFKLTSIAQLKALALAERRQFEDCWTANMKAACAAAGEPIAALPVERRR